MTDNLPTPHKPQLMGGGSVVALVPQTLEEGYRLADALSRSGLTPYNIKTPEAVLACLMAGAELGFPPFQSLQSFAIINGRPCIYGDAVPALLWSKGFDIEESFEGEEAGYPDAMRAVCTVTRPTGKKITRSFSVADAKEGLLWTKSGPWQTSRKRMLQMRARGFSARDGASDVMRGLPLYEEAQDYTPLREVDPNTNTGMAERLAARAVDVDAPGFNVRQITEATTQSLDEVLDGDTIPSGEPEPPRRRRRTKAEMEAARTAESGATANAQHVETGPASSASVTDASSDTAAATSSRDDMSGPSNGGATIVRAEIEPDEVQEDVPEYDEVYFHVDDAWDEKGRRPTYQNGVRFSSAGRRPYEDSEIFIFAQHAPAPPEQEDGLADAEDTSDDSPVVNEDAAAPSAALAEAIEAYRIRCRSADSALAIKYEIGQIARTEGFADMPEELRNAEFTFGFMCALALADAGRDAVKLAADPWFFELWLITKPDGAEVDDVWRRLMRAPAYRALKAERQAALAEKAIKATEEDA